MTPRWPQRAAGRAAARCVGLLVLTLASALGPTAALAHPVDMSKLVLELDPTGADVALTSHSHTLGRAVGFDLDDDGRIDDAEVAARRAAVAAYLDDRLRLAGEAGACAVTLREVVHDAAQQVVTLSGRYACPPPIGALVITNRLLLEQPGDHRTLAFIYEDGRGFNFIFDRASVRLEHPVKPAPAAPGALPEADAPRPATAPPGQAATRATPNSAWSVGARYVGLGVEHILIGLDHVLFVLALLLVSARLGGLLTLVTSFTLAHSTTLALAALGLVRASAAWVEPLIAASIAVVGVENMARHARRWRAPPAPAAPPWRQAALVFAFGLIHGLGFASVLGELGLPPDAALAGLVGFNVGVELGQLLIIALTWPPLRWLAMPRPWYPRFITAVSALITAAALGWFFTRILG